MKEPKKIQSFRIVPRTTKKAGKVVERGHAIVVVHDDGSESLADLTREAGIELTKVLARTFNVRLAKIVGEKILLRDAQGRPSGSLDLV